MSPLTSSLIPAGRTARLSRDGVALQLQTEYAPRPIPRITSTILRDGEVLQKLETPLDGPIETQEELEKVERLLIRQHGEALRWIKESDTKGGAKFSLTSLKGLIIQKIKPASELAQGPARVSAVTSVNLKVNIQADEPELLTESQQVRAARRTTLERLYLIDGIDRIYTLDWKGKFLSDQSSRDFKRQYSSINKHLEEVLSVFALLADQRGREQGVYEVENRRLYMVSHCGFVYFLSFKRMPGGADIEKLIRHALNS